MDDLLQKLLILRTAGVGPVKYNKLIAEYGDVYSAVDSMNLSNDFIDSVKREMERANELGIMFISDTGSKINLFDLNIFILFFI